MAPSNVQLETRIRELKNRVEVVEAALRTVTESVEELKTRPRRIVNRNPDEKGMRILEFLKTMPRIRVSPGTVAANLDGLTIPEAQTRMASMARRGFISSESPGGKRAVYFFEPETGVEE
jgi:hypothetical protein